MRLCLKSSNGSNADGVDGSCTIGVKCAILQLLSVAHERSHPMHVTTIGLDLAKNVFQVHGIKDNWEVAFKPYKVRTAWIQWNRNKSLQDQWSDGNLSALKPRLPVFCPERLLFDMRNGTWLVETIRASGHVCRVNRPNTRLLLTKYNYFKKRLAKREPSTQDKADLPRLGRTPHKLQHIWL